MFTAVPRGSPLPRAFQWETSTRPMETRWGRGRDCRSVRPQGCVSSCESVSPCFPLRDLAAPGGPAWGIEGLGEPLHVPASPALRTLGTASPGAVGLLRAQSRCCPACASSALSSAVWMCTRGTRHLSEWIFLKKCASVYAVHDISPHPCCHCHSALTSIGFIPHFFNREILSFTPCVLYLTPSPPPPRYRITYGSDKT